MSSTLINTVPPNYVLTSGANSALTWTNAISVSSMNYSSLVGFTVSTNTLTLSAVNISTQNTRIYQTATTNPVTSYSVIQASHVSTGTTNNALVLNPGGGNVGVGTTAPTTLLQVNGTTAINALQMNSGGSAFQIAQARNAGSGLTTGTISFPFTFSNTPTVTATILSASSTQVFSVHLSNVTTTGFTYKKTFSNISGGGGAAEEGFNWIAIG